MNRREFLRTAGGAAGGSAALAASGSATAAEGGGGGGGQPDYGGYLSGANGNTSTVDRRGQSEVTIQVGAGSQGLAFSPAAVWVDPGTTIIWEWTGNGGNHNVVGENVDFSSGEPVGEAGATFEQTFEESGIVQYYCSPHEPVGMLGAVAVGDVETKSAGGGGAKEQDPEHMGVPFQAHFVGIATVLMMFVSLVFTFFLLKYGESPHTKGGNN